MKTMKIALGIAMALCLALAAHSATDTTLTTTGSVREPYAWGDFTWVQGGSRLPQQVLSTKYFTGDVTMDINYNYNFAHPIDHTQSGSTACFRTDEINVSYIEAGGDFHDPQSGARGRLMLQFGSRATGVPRNDVTPLRGQYDLYTAMRYVTEGYIGMHFKKMHGINVDLGIFKSYVGLMGYNNFENWNYQNSFTSDNTPWFFTGLRVQTFPTDRLKIEYWVVNGWQTYAMANGVPGLGVQVDYRPKEWLKLLASAYYGHDAALNPSRSRFHSDNSVIVRYFNRPGHFLRRGAFSVTGDIGFENGAGVRPFRNDPANGIYAQNFLSYMVYHRWWLGKEAHFAWTIGGGQLHNPGRYLALLPPGEGVLTQKPGDQLDCWDASTGIQFMPNDHVTFGVEYVERHASAPYFSGRGGVTSPNGWNAPIGDPATAGWIPDLVKDEHRIILSMITRF